MKINSFMAGNVYQLIIMFIVMVFSLHGSLLAQNATITFKVIPEKSTIKLFDLNNSLAQKVTLTDSLTTIQVAAGLYRLEVSKKGYELYSESIQLLENDTKSLEIVLSKTPRGFFAKYKYWIIGGAVAVTTATILLLQKDKDKGPGLPIPPGRPGG